MTASPVQSVSERKTVPVATIPTLRSGEIPGLDGLRAISVLMVMVSHFGFGSIIPGGLGVTIFFFISGYLVTTLMLRETHAKGRVSIWHFYARRLIRLQPELWIMLVFSVLLDAIYGDQPPIRSIDVAGALLYFTNYVNILSNLPTDLRWPLLWSLAIEEHYYLIYPVLFVSLIPTPKRLFQVLIAILAVELLYRLLLMSLGVDNNYLYLATDTRLDSIGYGCATALGLWFCPERPLNFFRKYGGVLGVVGITLLLASLAYRNPNFRETWRYSIIGIAISLLFISFYVWRCGSILTNLLEMPPLKWMGRTSYGAYLWQFEAAGIMIHVSGVTWYKTPSVMAAISALVFIIATFAISALFSKLVQGPSNMLRRYIASIP